MNDCKNSEMMQLKRNEDGLFDLNGQNQQNGISLSKVVTNLRCENWW
jgi:hypothetical protein